MSLREEAITVLRRVEFHLMNDEEGDPTVAAEKVLDALLDWLDANDEHIAIVGSKTGWLGTQWKAAGVRWLVRLLRGN